MSGAGASDRVHSTALNERIAAVQDFVELSARLLTVGQLTWADVESDYRLLGINAALRRQLESLQAAVVLARQDLGHLAVAFVRSSLEDVMYLGFLLTLPLKESQRLFPLLGSYDATRSLLSQYAYVGKEVMASLWYPQEFLEAAQRKHDEVRGELKALKKQYRWQGGDWLSPWEWCNSGP